MAVRHGWQLSLGAIEPAITVPNRLAAAAAASGNDTGSVPWRGQLQQSMPKSTCNTSGSCFRLHPSYNRHHCFTIVLLSSGSDPSISLQPQTHPPDLAAFGVPPAAPHAENTRSTESQALGGRRKERRKERLLGRQKTFTRQRLRQPMPGKKHDPTATGLSRPRRPRDVPPNETNCSPLGLCTHDPSMTSRCGSPPPSSQARLLSRVSARASERVPSGCGAGL